MNANAGERREKMILFISVIYGHKWYVMNNKFGQREAISRCKREEIDENEFLLFCATMWGRSGDSAA